MPNEQKVTRKLRAILSADVKGYSLLMADDEVHTIRTLKAYRQIMSDLIQQHSGRVVDSPGDNLLAEFESALDAVECAVQIQRRLKKENTKFVENKRLQFRIGVNIGDVVHDGSRIYGSGVNVAARIEGLADPGGVCISRNAYDHVKEKSKLGYEYLGEHEVKNIKEPVRVYKILTDTDSTDRLTANKDKKSKLKWALIAVALFLVFSSCVVGVLYWKYFYLPKPENIDPQNQINFDLPKGPSIAVLPFDNMTGDPEQEFFCDGITENIISALSQSPKMFVIARNSTFAYKGKLKDVQQIGRELNAAYVIEGSIQKSNENIRITVQLIDTYSGHHLWAEQYNREMKDIFKLHDEIALNILKALQIKLTSGEQIRSRTEGIEDLHVAIKLLKALNYINQVNPEGSNLARQEVLGVIDTNPDISNAHALLAATYLQDLQFGVCKSNILCFGKATEATRKALLLDENNPDAHLLAGWLFVMQKDHDNAIASLKLSISINPNHADAYDMLGFTFAMSDQPSECINYARKALLLNPFPPSWYYQHLGICQREIKEYDSAITAFKKCIQNQSDSMWVLVDLAVTYVLSGQNDKAHKLGIEILETNPNFSINKFVEVAPFKTQDQTMRYRQALREAGLPD